MNDVEYFCYIRLQSDCQHLRMKSFNLTSVEYFDRSISFMITIFSNLLGIPASFVEFYQISWNYHNDG